MDKELVVLLVIIIMVWGVGLMSGVLKAECEKSLPRDQHCIMQFVHEEGINPSQ